jgi:hypothetical protein
LIIAYFGAVEIAESTKQGANHKPRGHHPRKRAERDGLRWTHKSGQRPESTGDGSFSVEIAERKALGTVLFAEKNLYKNHELGL